MNTNKRHPLHDLVSFVGGISIACFILAGITIALAVLVPSDSGLSSEFWIILAVTSGGGCFIGLLWLLLRLLVDIAERN